MNAIRVGVNLLWAVPGEVGGSEDYALALLDVFQRSGVEDLRLTLFVNRRFPLAHPGICERYPIVVAPVTGSSRPVRIAAEAVWLDRRARAEGMHLVHHLGGTMPPGSSLPGVVTVHDLQPLTHPDHFHPIKRAYLGVAIPRSLRRAAVVATLSEFTRGDVAEQMGVDPDRILVVPPGMDRRPPPDEVEVARVRRAHGLGERPFFLYPAITYPHKNHLSLVAAFARIAGDDRDATLVLTGGEGASEPDLGREIDRAGLGGRIIRTGRIPRPDLDALFDAAVAVVFPSRYEGFGIPVLEAMSHGLPVLVSSAAALPEVVGGGGVLIDPDDIGSWAAEMGRILAEPDHRSELSRRASARAGSFTWEASAGSLAEVYRVAASLTPPGPSSGGPRP